MNFNIFAETYTWTGDQGTDWEEAGNWESDDGVTFPGNVSNTDKLFPLLHKYYAYTLCTE